MTEYYNPDGSGPFYTDDQSVIPVGAAVVQTGAEGDTAISVITDIRINGTNLEVKTQTLYVSDADTESSWINLGTVNPT